MSKLQIALAFGALIAVGAPAMADPLPQSAPLQVADAARDQEMLDLIASFLPPGVTLENATEEQLAAALTAAINANPDLADELTQIVTAAGPSAPTTQQGTTEQNNSNTPEKRRGDNEEDEEEDAS
jgi:hypothetical protein